MEQFNIEVKGKEYHVEPICNEDHCTRFKIFDDCKYFFTLCIDEYGNWQMETDVVPLDENLVDEIGKAIEYYDR